MNPGQPSAGLETLLAPVTVGGLRLSNRVFVSAHTTNLAVDNLPGDRLAAYLTERAAGGVGLIITEGIRVHPTSAARDRTLCCFQADCVPAYRALTDAVHAAGAAIVGQLLHLGRQASGDLSRQSAWGASPVPWATGAAVPHQMTTAEIAELVEAFALGAGRLVEAGFDGLEVHLGHGHLLQQFLSPATNSRTDRYGGGLANRMRLAREVLAAVFDAAGDRTTVGVRVSGEEFLPGGLDLDQTVEIVRALADEFPLAFVDVSHSAYVGGYSLSTQMADMTFPAAPFRHLPARFKRELSGLSVLTACRIDDLALAAELVERSEADLVALTRAHIADPRLVAKARAGGAKVTHSCLACNQGCIGRIEKDLPLSCVVNPEVGHEAAWRAWRQRLPVARPRRVLVVGAGPAGLRAAVTAATAGHRVTLVDAGAVPGGRIRVAARMVGRDRLLRLTDELAAEANALGVELLLGRLVDPAWVLAGRWDTAVLATGASPGTEPGRVSVDAAITAPDRLGDHVLVYDERGDWQGAGLAEHLAGLGIRVELVAPVAGVAWNVTTYSRLALLPRLGQAGVRVRPLRRITNRVGDRVELADVLTGEPEVLTGVTAIVHAGPEVVRDTLYQELSRLDGAPDLLVVGDAYAPRSALEAVFEGHRAGALIDPDTAPDLVPLRRGVRLGSATAVAR